MDKRSWLLLGRVPAVACCVAQPSVAAAGLGSEELPHVHGMRLTRSCSMPVEQLLSHLLDTPLFLAVAAAV